MKIKAVKTYVYSPYSLNKGETSTVPDAVGARLVRLGFAENVEKAAQTAKKTRKASAGKSTAPGGKSAQRPAQKRTAGKK